jgi:hypothetical protein
MEAARTSKTLVNFYQTTRRYNPEDSHLPTRRRENLKSYYKIPVVVFTVWQLNACTGLKVIVSVFLFSLLPVCLSMFSVTCSVMYSSIEVMLMGQ